MTARRPESDLRGTASGNRFAKMNRPPPGSSWAWMTAEMLESPAWRALPARSVKIVMRIVLEHLKHGGVKNGKLPVSFDDFETHGVRRRSILEAILIASELGFVDRLAIGTWAGNDSKRPSLYGLTWLPRCDGMSASNRWAKVETTQQAKAIILRVKTKMLPLLRDVWKRRKQREPEQFSGGDSPVSDGETPPSQVAKRYLSKPKFQQKSGGETPLLSKSRLYEERDYAAEAAAEAAEAAAAHCSPPLRDTAGFGTRGVR
jgi:hypothetical protein